MNIKNNTSRRWYIITTSWKRRTSYKKDREWILVKNNDLKYGNMQNNNSLDGEMRELIKFKNIN